MTRFSLFSSIAILLLMGAQYSFGAQYAVGTCKSNLPSYSTISAAVAAVPPGSTILVCPGTYPEQVVINQPLTLQGITSGNSGRAIVTVPGSANGAPSLQVNSQSAVFGAPAAAQVLVQNVPSNVNISDITVDGTGGQQPCSPGPVLFGIFYSQSSGTVNHVTMRSQQSGGCGVGIAVENGIVNAVVSVTNNSVHDADFGITSYDRALPGALLAHIDGNYITNMTGKGIWIIDNAGTAYRDTVTRAFHGIDVRSGLASVTSSTLADIDPANGSAIILNSGATASGNRISGALIGVNLFSGSTATNVAQSNMIMNTTKAFEFQCNAAKVVSNTINDTSLAFDQLAPTDVLFLNNLSNSLFISVPCGS